jgi:hypothetical protein
MRFQTGFWAFLIFDRVALVLHAAVQHDVNPCNTVQAHAKLRYAMNPH